MTSTFRDMGGVTLSGAPPRGRTSLSLVRRRIGPFGIKDLFTLINLFSGVAAIRFALQDRVQAAGYAVVVGFLCGDLLDGLVARRTGTGNSFGAEFDSVTDHFVHVVVPSPMSS